MPDIPEWLLTAIAVLVGAAVAYLERRGKRAALEASETITKQLTAVIEGVETAGRLMPDDTKPIKQVIKKASELAGVDKALAERVRTISELMK